jgi:hypothetical protein
MAARARGRLLLVSLLTLMALPAAGAHVPKPLAKFV